MNCGLPEENEFVEDMSAPSHSPSINPAAESTKSRENDVAAALFLLAYSVPAHESGEEMQGNHEPVLSSFYMNVYYVVSCRHAPCLLRT